jgi:cytoskeletal protein CcmA (bactofilin family)
MGLFDKRSGDKGGHTPSLLAAGSHFNGDLQTSGPLLANGHVHGNGTVGGDLTMGAGAQWHGDIQARSATIAGTIVGNLLVTEALTVRATAIIRGDVTARGATVAPGAVVEGEIRITAPTSA